MSTYFVTFRISKNAHGVVTYDARYQKLMDSIQETREGGYWEETTSFVIVQSRLDTISFCAAISKGLNAREDMVVAFDPSDMSLAYFGAVEDPKVLASFFALAKKVG